ncbi:MAG TPA: hypothetical protein VM841_04790, partial [Actinomycetota bacterium]|nr:hypothetical protein [Actinomycetota bacterium]
MSLQLDGRLVERNDPDYESLRTSFNGLINRRPAEPAWVASLREHGRAGLLYARLHGVMAALGIIFLVVFVSERVAPPGSP